MAEFKTEYENSGPLLEKLTEYGKSDAYPFHMPGHKRQIRMGITSFPNPFSVDITEIDGFDNLHHAEGILRSSMEHAAAVYGSDRTYYLVNGSTAGILSAVCGLTEPGGRILMARNSHKAAYHGAVINRLDPVYVYPEIIGEYGIQGGIAPRDVERILEAEQALEAERVQETGRSLDAEQTSDKDAGNGKHGIRAVFITSPTYEGIVSDVKEIARICHAHGIPLIVDEAHGAHFPFGEGFPKSALDCGADIVIQSLHKTLPSLTQTALLHIRSRLVRPEQIERYLSLFQSSSPSYVFLASIENCISYMEREGQRRMEEYGKRMRSWMRRAGGFCRLAVLNDSVCGRYGVKERDLSKIVVFPQNCGMSGARLADRLRERYHLEPEMACSRYVILMTSLMDTEEGLERLFSALSEMDREAVERAVHTPAKEVRTALDRKWDAGVDSDEHAGAGTPTWLEHPQKRMRIADAWNSQGLSCPVEAAAGLVCKGFITVYPPGVPMLVPGEVVTEEAVRLIVENRRLGLTVEGISEQGEIPVCSAEY